MQTLSSSPQSISSGTASKGTLTTKILCIDDDPDIGQGLRRNFRKEGIETLLAYHGTQGYWLACTEKPDLIIVDLRMPRGNGEQVIQSLKQNTLTCHIPIIVLTGLQRHGSKKTAIAMGADCFLQKPTPFPEILKSVEHLL